MEKCIMKCSVPGCDTDENVVSYTSVFFVKFPEEPVVQQEWITVFGITDANLVHALLAGELKVCSCHFAEDCFGHHPVYGYRYLLPGAVPTIVPQQQIADFLPEQLGLLGEGEDAHQNYYFIYESGAPSSESEVALEELKSEHDSDVMSDANYQSENGEALEEIGIKFFDGKYYFFQLDADPADDETFVPDLVPDGHAPDDTVTLPTLEHPGSEAAMNYADERTHESVKNEVYSEELQRAADIVGTDEQVFVEEGLENELSVEQILDKIGNAREETLVDDDAGTEQLDWDDNGGESNVDEACDVTVTGATTAEANLTEYDETDPGNTTEYIEDAESATESLEHGSIEALDEVYSSNGDVFVRNDSSEKAKGHVCSECGKSFSYPSGLAKHMLTHTKTKPYSCDQCAKSFSQKVNLKVHMRQHTGERPVPRFTCEVCGKKCHRRSELRVHLGVHQKQFPLACPVCDSRFANVTTLYSHLRQDHRDQGVTMEQVTEKFMEHTNPQIIADRQYVSEGETVGPDGRWECSVCGQSFVHFKQVRKHKRKLHPKIFRCKYCQRSFPYRSMLEKHMAVHTLERRFRCEHCRALFSQRANLNKHVKIKHCQIFGLVESEYGDLVAEHVDGRTVPYNCLPCNKSFFREATWLAHLDTHHKEHQPAHDDQQPTCEKCNMTFASRFSLQTHRRRMHCPVEPLLPEKLRIYDVDGWGMEGEQEELDEEMYDPSEQILFSEA